MIQNTTRCSYLVFALDLVVASDDICVRRRHTAVALRRRTPVLAALRAVVHGRPVLGLGLPVVASVIVAAAVAVVLARVVLNVDVRDAAIAALAVLADLLVLVRWFGELGDNVPGVEEAGDEAEDAEEDVDDGVGGADTALDPD